MRKAKKDPRLLPYAAGIISGYLLTLAAAAVIALPLSFTDIAADMAGAAAIACMAAGAFICGRTGGAIRRRNGLKTGMLCGALYFIPLMIISVIAGAAGSIMLPVKALVCLAFSAAGGVAGVNSPKNS